MSEEVKEVIISVIIIIALIIGFWFYNSHQVPYEFEGICVEKFTIGDSNGNAKYKAIFKYEDGVVETIDVDASRYISVKTGNSYIFKRSKFVW